MSEKSYKIFIFDVDGTIAEPYDAIHTQIADIICTLLKKGKKIGFLTARGTNSVKENVVGQLPCSESDLENVFLAPNAGAELLTYKDGAWHSVHSHIMQDEEVEKIGEAYLKIVREFEDELGGADVLNPAVTNKENLLISLTAIRPGSDENVRKTWDPGKDKRRFIVAELQKSFPNFQFRIGGGTTIDVMQEGLTKAFGLHAILKQAGVTLSDAIFIGDGIFPGGNDWDVKETRIDTIAVEDPEDCLVKLQAIVKEHN